MIMLANAIMNTIAGAILANIFDSGPRAIRYEYSRKQASKQAAKTVRHCIEGGGNLVPCQIDGHSLPDQANDSVQVHLH